MKIKTKLFFFVKLTLADFNQEYVNFLTLYPHAQDMAAKHMISFLNSKLNLVPEVEPAFNNESDLSKLLNHWCCFFI